MKTSDFDYDLPAEYIAQNPVEPRDCSKLMVYYKESDKIVHTQFRDLPQYINKDDLLVINETRVIAARLMGKKESGGKVELLLIKKEAPSVWEVLVKGKHLVPGKKIIIEEGLSAQVIDSLDGTRRLIQFSSPIENYIDKIGHVPLPPYIHSTLSNPNRYQTIYAKEDGSAAAPTAGLHFTRELLDELSDHGVGLARVILHVGLDTFSPVREEDAVNHKMHSEWCSVPIETIEMIKAARQRGSRIIAVGTTTVRALESAANHAENGRLIEPFSGNTDLFIMPGYQFKVVDAMITNFHLPRSTLIMMVSAFVGRDKILQLYEIAKKEKYRFYSFGDAMLLI